MLNVVDLQSVQQQNANGNCKGDTNNFCSYLFNCQSPDLLTLLSLLPVGTRYSCERIQCSDFILRSSSCVGGNIPITSSYLVLSLWIVFPIVHAYFVTKFPVRFYFEVCGRVLDFKLSSTKEEKNSIAGIIGKAFRDSQVKRQQK